MPLNDTGNEFALLQETDAVLIECVSSKYQAIIRPLCEVLVNSALLTLRMIGVLGYQDYAVPVVDRMNFDQMTAWRKICDHMSHETQLPETPGN